MWVWRRGTWRGWDLISYVQYGWCKWMDNRGEGSLADMFETPQGWYLLSFMSWRWYQSYSLVVIDEGRFVGQWPLTFDEFDQFPQMPPGFFIPF